MGGHRRHLETFCSATRRTGGLFYTLMQVRKSTDQSLGRGREDINKLSDPLVQTGSIAFGSGFSLWSTKAEWLMVTYHLAMTLKLKYSTALHSQGRTVYYSADNNIFHI